MRPPLGVYLHVPYCATICGYCDFNTYARGDRSGWADTAIAELRLTDIDRPADTVFFGGGTPTLLTPRTARSPPLARPERPASSTSASTSSTAARSSRTTTGAQRSSAALSAAPDHISAYGLTVEPGTRLHAQIRRGEVPPPDEDALAERYLLTEHLLEAAGLHWYEVSNWARDAAARCHHNVGYWHGGEWWGIGPGAHSGVGGRRWWNVRHPATWAAKVAAGERPEDAGEDLDAEQRRLERLMLEVRTREGVTAGGVDAGRLVDDGLIDLSGERAVLTLRGRLLADLVTRRLAG